MRMPGCTATPPWAHGQVRLTSSQWASVYHYAAGLHRGHSRIPPTNQICSHTVFPSPLCTAFEQVLYSRWGSLHPVSKKYIPCFIFQTLWKIPNTYRGLHNSPRKPQVPLTQLQQLSTHIIPMPRIVLKQIPDVSFHPQLFQHYILSFPHTSVDISLLPTSHFRILSHPARFGSGLTSSTVSSDLVT